jgi:hypothetical protein
VSGADASGGSAVADALRPTPVPVQMKVFGVAVQWTLGAMFVWNPPSAITV